jgi:hypothetical protein
MMSLDEVFPGLGETAGEIVDHSKSNEEVELTAAQVEENKKCDLNVFPAPPGM